MKLRIILAIIILATLTLACGGGGEWIEWNNGVNRRQRENDIPLPELDDLGEGAVEVSE